MKLHEVLAIEHDLNACYAFATVATRNQVSVNDVLRIRDWMVKRALGSLSNPTMLGDGGGSDDGTVFE
jgi:hypothetical protein